MLVAFNRGHSARNCRCWVVALALRRWPDDDRRASLVEKNLVDIGGAVSVAWRKKPAEDARRRRLRSALGEVALQLPASFAERLCQVAFTREPVKRYEHLTGFSPRRRRARQFSRSCSGGFNAQRVLRSPLVVRDSALAHVRPYSACSAKPFSLSHAFAVGSLPFGALRHVRPIFPNIGKPRARDSLQRGEPRPAQCMTLNTGRIPGRTVPPRLPSPPPRP